MGDEGSEAYLGKRLVSDILKGLAPKEIMQQFYEKFSTTPDEVMDSIYIKPQPNRTFADYSIFLFENINIDYCTRMVYDGFMRFFERNISFYDFRNISLSAVGTACTMYRDLFEAAATDFGARINRIEESPIHGLIQYHSKD